jgi:hypothetical protein
VDSQLFEITSFSSVVYPIFLQCANTKRVKFIQPTSYIFQDALFQPYMAAASMGGIPILFARFPSST